MLVLLRFYKSGVIALSLKSDLIERIKLDLLDVIKDKDEYDNVVNIITIALGNYELSEICTELTTHDESNIMFIKKYIACLMIDGKSEKTMYQYSHELQRFYAAIGKSFVNIDTDDIRLYLALCKQKGLSNRSLATIRSYLFAFFEWMATEEIITKNPCIKIKPVKYNRETEKPFSSVEVDALRSACKNNRERALIETLLASGVRREELCDLEIRDVDFTEKSLVVRKGKGGKRRVTYLNDLAILYLKKYFAERGNLSPNEKVFVTQRGNISNSGLRYILKEIGERSGVENIHPHRFRRTFATSLVNRGMDVQEMQRLLGHVNINTTMCYVCVDDDRVRNSYNKYSQVF